MRRLRWFGLYTVFMLMLSSTAPGFAQEAPGPCELDPNAFMPSWQSDENDCTLHQDIQFTIDLAYPEDLTQYPNAKQIISDYLTQQRAGFLSGAASFLTPTDFTMTASFPWSLEINYDETHFSDTVKTIIFSLYSYSGGAHGGHVTSTFTFDLASDTLITLPDLFWDGTDAYATLAPLAEADLKVQLKDISDAAWIEAGTAPQPENYQAWALTEDSLILFFQEYQVAAYAAGAQQVSIPLMNLKDVLKPEYQPAS